MTPKRSHITSGLICLFITMLLLGCTHRYRNIPRVHFSTKKSNAKSQGHYVSSKNAQDFRQKNMTTSQVDSIDTKLAKTKPQILPRIKTKSFQNTHQHALFDIDSLPLSDTVSDYAVDKSLMKNSSVLFAFVAAANAGILLAPLINYLLIGLLIGLGLLVLGYFVSKFIENAKENRIQPYRYKIGGYGNREQLKKAFNITMIASGSAFALALFTTATGSFALPYFFFILGLLMLYAGLLIGLIYLVMGA
jgi:hypothetical protein